MKRILGLSVFSLLSLIINLFASAPDNLLSKKLSVSFNVPANNAIGIHEFFLIDAVNSTNYYFKTSNDSSDSPFWLFELYHYRKTTSTDATLRIISSDGGWVDIVLSFTSSNFASSTISGYGTNGEVEWTGTADVSVLDLQISEIPSANQPNILTTDLSPTSISGGTLSAQDSYWPVYNESISFTSPGTLSVNITNGDDNPTGSGSYSYSTTGTNSASLSYTIDGAGITFEYALQFTGENAGIYTKYADYGGGTTDVTTGPFSLSGVAVPEQFNWEEYDDFSTGSLNASKWGTMNFYGGDKPEVKDGRVEFSSSGKSVSATSDFKQGWNSTEFINYTEGAPGSVLYVNDSTVYGMEASITLPVGSSPKTAICLQVGSLNPFGQHIAELMNDSGNGAGFWIHDYVADTGVSISASSATTFQVAVIHENEKNTFYINSKKVHELDASNFTPDWFGINTFENDGKAYAVYADNVRVLRRSSFSSLIKIAPLAISAFRDQVYLQGQNELVKLDGASEINFDLQLVGKPAVTAATITVDGVTYDLTNLQAPPQFRTTYGYSIYDDELYDVESSSDSDWSSYVNGKNFSFSFTSEGDSYSYSHDLPPVS
ncbi:MAG: hypothetical protein P8N49_06560, partial [Opitutales bacterium]|nr:hypothetical protein [Opitutales bacterium]